MSDVGTQMSDIGVQMSDIMSDARYLYGTLDMITVVPVSFCCKRRPILLYGLLGLSQAKNKHNSPAILMLARRLDIVTWEWHLSPIRPPIERSHFAGLQAIAAN